MRSESTLTMQKLDKIILSISKAKHNLNHNNKKGALGDIHYIIDNAYEAMYLLEAEMENEDV